MSYCKKEGKDEIIFATEEDMKSPSTALIHVDEDETEAVGLILPNGDINWNCPCLGGMASGPCGTEFRDAFSCFHYSKEEVKGSDCIDSFRKMHECMEKFPELYPSSHDEETDAEKSQDVSDQLEGMEREGSKTDSPSDSALSQQTQAKSGL